LSFSSAILQSGSGKTSAIVENSNAPAKNCNPHVKMFRKILQMPNSISCFSYPKVSSQKTNGIDSIISQVKERHAQHESSSKALQNGQNILF